MKWKTKVCALLALLVLAFSLLACTGDPGCVQFADQHPTHCVDP